MNIIQPTYTKEDGIAYQTPRLHGVAFCSEDADFTACDCTESCGQLEHNGKCSCSEVETGRVQYKYEGTGISWLQCNLMGHEIGH
jgi:hypothetical protein